MGCMVPCLWVDGWLVSVVKGRARGGRSHPNRETNRKMLPVPERVQEMARDKNLHILFPPS